MNFSSEKIFPQGHAQSPNPITEKGAQELKGPWKKVNKILQNLIAESTKITQFSS